MEEIMTYALFGYICGSILFARVAAALFHQDREYEKSRMATPVRSTRFVMADSGAA